MKGTLMKTYIRLAFLSMALCMLPAKGANPLPPEIDGQCLSQFRTPWDMVDFVFVQQPNRTPLSWTKRIGGTLGTVAAGLAAGWLGHRLYYNGLALAEVKGGDKVKAVVGILADYTLKQTTYNSNKRPKVKDFISIGHLLAVPVLWFAGKKIFSALRSSPIKDKQRWQMEAVLKIWKEARAYFPHELHATFDILHELKEAKAAEYEMNRDASLEFILAKLNAHYTQLKETKFTFPEITAGYSLRT